MTQRHPNIPIASGQGIANVMRSAKALPIPLPFPHLTILIHGVNDVGEAYQAQDEGICLGLNARLNRNASLAKPGGDLRHADYNMSFAEKLAQLEKSPDSEAAKKLRSDPDSILFHRAAVEGTWSPVIPFYWGFREESKAIVTTAQHGQWLDRHGNRIDKNGAKGGGPFVNATSNLVDFWSNGKGSISAKVLDTINRGTFSPIKASPARRYFVLAALRLASLIEMIRNEPETQYAAVNVMCHSQGCNIALLAQALLNDRGQRPADCLILQNPPYVLDETVTESLPSERGDQQQTTQARLQTLINIVGFVTGQPQTSPAFSDALKTQYLKQGVAGKHWKPAAGAQRCIKDAGVTFAERDNRGKVYLYFTPFDKTVSLPNVHGIGWQGVPDSISTVSGYDMGARGAPQARPPVLLPAMDDLQGKRFFQRVFTRATEEEDSAPEPVGERTGYHYVLRNKGVASPTGGVRGTIPVGERRYINGEALNPPCIPNLGKEKLPVGYIDASIGLTSGHLDPQTRYDFVNDPRAPDRHGKSLGTGEQNSIYPQVQATYDRRAEAAGNDYVKDNSCRVRLIEPAPGGKLRVSRSETPNEMKERIEKTMTDENSFHSGIPANKDHHEKVSAYDLALGEPVPALLEICGWLPYLRAVADWRTDWSEMRVKLKRNANPEHQRLLDYLKNEPSDAAKALIRDTDKYRSTGQLPPQVADVKEVKLLINQTTAERFNNDLPRPFKVAQLPGQAPT